MTDETALATRWTRRWRRVTAGHSGIMLGVGLALAINLLIAGAYLWSRGGQTTHVRLEAQSGHFAAYVDGKLQVQASLEAPSSGGFYVALEDTRAVPSLPQPRGIDSVRVTDLDSGVVLFEDDFSELPLKGSGWTDVIGPAVVGDGVLGANNATVMLRMDDRGWGDYTVDVTYRNITSGSVAARFELDGSGVVYNFRPFRHFDNGLVLLDKGKAVKGVGGPRLEMARSETMKSMLAMTLRPYPYALALLLVGAVAVFALASAVRGLNRRTFAVDLSASSAWVVVVALAATVFGVTLFLNYSYGSHMPHIPDEVSYIFQAKVLSSGRLAAPQPPVPESFDFFFPSLIVTSHGKFASVYPFGHPLMLAIGVRIGALWLIPPLVGAACVTMMFAIGRRVYNVRTGMLAALILAGSPFFLMNASNFMSHNTAVFYLLASLLFLAFARKRPVLYPLLSGVFFGLVFNTRPLTTTALVLPFGAMLLSSLLPRGQRASGAKQIGAFVLGGLLMLGAYGLYNFGSTGTLSSGQAGDVGQVVGFGGLNTVTNGMQNELTQLAFFSLVLNGWPRYIGLMFVLLPFVLATKNKWDWFMLACAVSVTGVYTLYLENGVAYGPRYWYESIPFLMFLAARGAERAAEVLADAVHGMWQRWSGSASNRRPVWASVLIVYGLAIALVSLGSYRWLFDDAKRWRVDQMPARARDMRSYNGADDRLITLVHDMKLHNALVLTSPCSNWQCIGAVYWLNSPTFDSDVVYAKDIAAKNADLFDKYPDRAVYTTTYLPPSIVPFGESTSATPSGPGAGTMAPKARDIPRPTSVPTSVPVPTATPDPLAAAKRDDQRRRDLLVIIDLLESYRQQNGSYPQVNGVQTLCGFPGDVACVLRSQLDPLPADPMNNQSYWYMSDGKSFTLFAAMEVPPGPSYCPAPVPEHLASVTNLYCVQR